MNKDLILIDTNIVLYALNQNPTIYPFVNQKKLAISFVSEIELLGWKGMTAASRKVLQQFFKECLYIDYNYQIRQQTIWLKSQYNLKLADALIAACSLEFDIPLVSADKDFSKVKEINFINLIPSL
ncbi:type II toxin-antitoxin system VapC family toxin [Deminuibacter soli]|uniref:PIN domain-containing protein n=1 Tax=Deminuibacter soli TaxID=2291815 RepID=A0A3E1NDT7_9BACT|nr:type II toxin-antitoxin system VapC family toxin [Deminuibacter soli]RFM26037.1 PIN domain-containing protein [Deminuibacter soli]